MLGKAAKEPKPAPLKYAPAVVPSNSAAVKIAILVVGGALAFYFLNKLVLTEALQEAAE